MRGFSGSFQRYWTEGPWPHTSVAWRKLFKHILLQTMHGIGHFMNENRDPSPALPTNLPVKYSVELQMQWQGLWYVWTCQHRRGKCGWNLTRRICTKSNAQNDTCTDSYIPSLCLVTPEVADKKERKKHSLWEGKPWEVISFLAINPDWMKSGFFAPSFSTSSQLVHKFSCSLLVFKIIAINGGPKICEGEVRIEREKDGFQGSSSVQHF